MEELKYNDNVIKTDYSDILQQFYIDYAMSVIISRALPDVRDGLKPVQRRTLYDMRELGIKHDKPYRKSARIVGDTMGKYHPHGDSSIYESLVVMTQDFKKWIPLVDGHGNFGSIEGDGAAAMRYTEARLSKISEEVFLEDLDKDVIDFAPNFDETEKEPVVLPARVSNLLINGAEGIAVGMATSIPSHNLGEVIDATIALIKNENLTSKKLMKYIIGPDFPTGGVVSNKDELLSIYETGQGKIKIRGKVVVEKGKAGKNNIVITEIPYTMIGAGISKFLLDVAQLIENKKITDITDISNQSSKEGIRIVLETKKDADIDNIINILYKKTKLEDTFSVNMLAVCNGKPETLSLKDILTHSIDFQFEISNRKYSNLLSKEENKKEIQEGLIKACDVIDLIIEILRGSQNIKQAKECLVSGNIDGIKFKSNANKTLAKMLRFTEKQADAILEMRLYKLIGLEINELKKEFEITKNNIKKYNDLLNNYDLMADDIINNLKKIKKEFNKDRSTLIENIEDVEIKEEEIKEEEVYFLMDRFGYCKTIDVAAFERNNDAALSENKYCFSSLNTGKICIFTNKGVLHSIKTMDVPQTKFREKGTPIDNISKYDASKEVFVYACDIRDLYSCDLIFITKLGQAKITKGSEFIASKKTILASKLSNDDEIICICPVKDDSEIVFKTNDNLYLRINAKEIPFKGKNAVGVKAISLKDNYLVSANICSNFDDEILIDNSTLKINKIKTAKRASKPAKLLKK